MYAASSDAWIDDVKDTVHVLLPRGFMKGGYALNMKLLRPFSLPIQHLVVSWFQS